MASRGLPRTLPESLKFKKKEHSPLVKARVHARRADKLRKEEKDQQKAGDPTSPHLQYIERYTALLMAVSERRALIKKEFKGLLAKDEVGEHEMLGHLIGTLPRARLDSLFKNEQIAVLNKTLGRRPLSKIIDDNEALQDMGIRWREFVAKKRDLKFSLGLQAYKAAQALGTYFAVIRYAADPKVRKKLNLVKDVEVLNLANAILRDVATHIIEEMQKNKDQFFEVGDRKAATLLPRGPKA